MNMHRRLFMLFIAACTFLISPVFTLASEVDSLLNSSQVTSWAYFRDPNLPWSKWYISEPYGTTYALGLNNSGHSSWVALANQVPVANLDFLNKRVSLSSYTAAFTPHDWYWAISLVGGEGGEYVYGNTANQWANLIAGKTSNLDWYFFQVQSTGIWYIVQIAGTNSTILRLELNASKSDYDWQQPLNGSGVAVDTSTWTKEFFQENGIWKVRFSAASSLLQPIIGPLTVVREGSFFDVNYNNGVTRYVNGVDQWRQHLGTDFIAAANTPVVSISAGKLVYGITDPDPFQSVVIIQQPDGVQVVYGHITSALVCNALR